jgi:D-alanyl-D-alanine carboxypeptidase (penicillin-binding protein 5/6)
MNKTAKELNLINTNFENPTGLDDTTTNHYSSAQDIAIMSRELIKHDIVLKYSNVWQDSIRNGEFTLTNTNRLVRYYEGCTGLKTGSTDKAGFCVSTTAKRGNMHLIAVIMGSTTREARNSAARTLLDYGFANFKLYENKSIELNKIPVRCGETDNTDLYTEDFYAVINAQDKGKITVSYTLPEYIEAPIKEDQPIGKITYKIGENVIGESEIYTKASVGKISLMNLYMRMLSQVLFD